MPDAPATPPVGDPGTPPVGDPPATPPVGTTTDAPPVGASDVERLTKELAETRREAAGYRTKLKTFEESQLSEAEKATARIKELEAQNASLSAAQQATRVRDAALASARKAGFWDPEIGAGLVNASDIAFDEQGNPKNMDALVAAIAKDKPRLINGGAGQPDFGAGNRGASGGGGTDMDTLIRRAVGRS